MKKIILISILALIYCGAYAQPQPAQSTKNHWVVKTINLTDDTYGVNLRWVLYGNYDARPDYIKYNLHWAKQDIRGDTVFSESKDVYWAYYVNDNDYLLVGELYEYNTVTGPGQFDIWLVCLTNNVEKAIEIGFNSVILISEVVIAIITLQLIRKRKL